MKVKKHYFVDTPVLERKRKGLRERVRCVSPVGEESMTSQSEARGCDINVLVASFMKAGFIPPPDIPGVFEDCSDLGDFQYMQNKILKGIEAFEALPVDIRDGFENDPEKFLVYVDTATPEEFADLYGVKPPPPKVVVPEVVDEPPKPTAK